LAYDAALPATHGASKIEAIVSDPLTTSRTARESLARGLNALQNDPSVPSHLVDLAAPIAQAMGALHQLERTQQLAPYADLALNHVRGALSGLQSGGGHPAVAAALEQVAQSLTLVHSLSRMATGPTVPGPLPVPQAAPPAAPPPPVRGNTAGMPARAPVANAQPAFPQGQQMPPAPFGGHAPPYAPPQAHPAQAPQAPPMVARDPFAAPAPPGAAPPPAGAPATPSMPVPAPPPAGNAALFAAELGAHSPTNFYKGLAGNDIIDHGGLFVSTYVPPKLGTPVRLKVSLPGGYEFEANAVVQWTREQGGDAPPGFGARFTGITNEARQLVYRYVRNREPMFYDDL
jgi:uncharacterized protein (TIGR02266 family)